MKIKIGQAFTATLAIVATVALIVNSVHQIFQHIDMIRGVFLKEEPVG